MKKLAIAFFIVVLCAAVGFAGGSQSNSGKTVLTLYTWWSGSERTMGEALVADYEASHPNIRIEQNHGGSQYTSRLNTLIASGSTPDVFMATEDLVNDWGEKGVGSDLNTYYSQTGVKPVELFMDNYLYTTGGHLWGIAVCPVTILLYYNKELLKQAGVAEPPNSAVSPWTWDQYVAAAKKLTKDSAGRTPNDSGFNYDSVTQWGTVMPTQNQGYMLPLLYSAGTSVVNESGTAFALNSAAGTRVVQAMANLTTVDKVAPTYATTISNTFSNQPAMLMNGQIAMFISGAWDTGDFLNEKFDVGLAQVPAFSNKGDNLTWGAALMMKKNASPEAFEFYQYVINFNNWVSAAQKHQIALPSGIPTTRNTFSDPALNAAWNSVNDPASGRIIADIIQNACRIGENVTVKNWSEIMGQIVKPGLDRVWMGEESPEQALQAISRQLDGKYQGVWK